MQLKPSVYRGLMKEHVDAALEALENDDREEGLRRARLAADCCRELIEEAKAERGES